MLFSHMCVVNSLDFVFQHCSTSSFLHMDCLFTVSRELGSTSSIRKFAWWYQSSRAIQIKAELCVLFLESLLRYFDVIRPSVLEAPHTSLVSSHFCIVAVIGFNTPLGSHNGSSARCSDPSRVIMTLICLWSHRAQVQVKSWVCQGLSRISSLF